MGQNKWRKLKFARAILSLRDISEKVNYLIQKKLFEIVVENKKWYSP